MNEFKGTKGKWELLKDNYFCEIQTKKPLKSICAINSNLEEHLYNALLISKAPEMLDMLQLCKEYFLLKTDTFSEERAEAIGQLIKEATKL
jgi:hypothetical protein